ncbi:MAG: hypothetical protein E7568_03215 [Ruminococcaceae bacterium]|nr:hypothetical protein [Oscillospiraceae bacterium]
MDELSEKINSILSDPQSVAGLKEMAENLFGEKKAAAVENTDGIDIASLMSCINMLKNKENGENEKLLLALKPHLSEERQKRVDTAVRILKLLEIAPFIKESGLLGGIL